MISIHVGYCFNRFSSTWYTTKFYIIKQTKSFRFPCVTRHAHYLEGMTVVSRTSRSSWSFHLHSLSHFAHIKVVSPTLISQIFFTKTGEHHCPQVTIELYLTRFPVKF